MMMNNMQGEVQVLQIINDRSRDSGMYINLDNVESAKICQSVNNYGCWVVVITYYNRTSDYITMFSLSEAKKIEEAINRKITGVVIVDFSKIDGCD